MLKVRKYCNFKIILIASTVFLCNANLYSFPDSKDTLRISAGQSNTHSRIKRSIDIVTQYGQMCKRFQSSEKAIKKLIIPNGEVLSVFRLTTELVYEYAQELVDIANLLDILKWNSENLKTKWSMYPNQHSFVIVNKDGEIIGMAMGCERDKIQGEITKEGVSAFQRHLYLGPGAIKDGYRNMSLVQQLMRCCVQSYVDYASIDPSNIPVVLQATRRNKTANYLYGNKLGFEVIGQKEYPGREYLDQDILYFKDAASLLYRFQILLGSVSPDLSTANSKTRTEL